MSSVQSKGLRKKTKMNREYLLYFKEPIVKDLLSTLFEVRNLKKIDAHIMKFLADDILKSTIVKSIHAISNDLNNSLFVLVSPVDIPFSEYVLEKMVVDQSEGVYSLSQGVIDLLLKKDEFLKSHLFSWFSGLDYNLAITGKTYVEMGFSIAKSCTYLSIHRNTMEYRLNKIKELFNVDLHSFDDGILFLTYLSLSHICA